MPEVAALVARVTAETAQAEAGLTRVDKQIQQVAKSASQAGGQTAGFGSSMNQLGGVIGGVATKVAVAGTAVATLAGAGFGLGIKTASDFSREMSAVGAATQATGTDLAGLRAKALELGKDVSLAGVDATEAAQAITALGKGGVSTGDLMGGAAKGGLLLFSAGAKSIDEAAGIAVKGMAAFNKTGADVPHIADVIAAAAGKSATDITQLGAAFNQVAGVAAGAGFSLEELGGTLAFMAQRGMEGSDAGTSLKTALIRLEAPTDKAANLMEDLGINVRDANGSMLPFAEIADILKEKLGGLSDAQRDAALNTIFGADSIRLAIPLVQEGGDAIREWTEKVNDSGYAARVGAQLNDNLSGSFEQLKATIQTGAIEVFSRFEPAVRKVTDAGTALITDFLDNPAVIAGIDRLAVEGARKIEDLLNTVRDPAFQTQVREWGTAALETGRAIAGLAGDVKDVLGPPLAAAVGWFSDLDEAGKKNVLTLGLVAGSVIVFRKELGTLLSVGNSVIGMFTRKAVAKAALEKANVSLAGSAAKTALSFGTVATAAGTAAAAIAAGTAVTVVATGAAAGLILALDKYNEATGGIERAEKALITTRQAMAVASSLGATAENQHAEAFNRALQFYPTAITSSKDLADAWNWYVNRTSMAGESTAGLRLATEALVNVVTGQATPAVQQHGAALWELNNVGTDAQRSMNEVASAIAAIGGGAGPSIGGVDELSEAYFRNAAAAKELIPAQQQAKTSADDLAASQEALAVRLAAQQAVMETTSQSVAPLQAAYDLLNQRVAAGIPLTAEQAHLLSTLPGYIAGATSGYDGLITGIAQTAIALQHSNTAAGGASGAFGGLAGDAGSLKGQLDLLRASAIALDGALGALGTQNSKLSAQYNILGERVTVLQDKQKAGIPLTQQEAAELATLTAAQEKLALQLGDNTAKMRDLTLQQIENEDKTKAATQAANDYLAAMGQLATQTDVATTAGVGLTDGFGNVATAADTGKASVDNIGAGAAAMVSKMGLAKASIAGVTTAIQGVPTDFYVTAHVDISGALANIATLSNSIPRSPAKEGPFRTLPDWMAIYEGLGPSGDWAIATVGNTAAAMSAALKEAADEGAKEAAEIASAVARGITDSLGAMGALANFDFVNDSPTGSDIGWFGFLNESIIASMAESATRFDEETTEITNRYAETTQKVGSSVKSSTEGLAAIGSYAPPTVDKVDQFLTDLADLMERFQTWAGGFEEDGLKVSTTYANAVEEVTGSLDTSTRGLMAISGYTSPAEAEVTAFMRDLADLMERFGTWAGGFEADGLAISAQYGKAVGETTGGIANATAGLAAIGEYQAPPEEKVSAFLQGLSDLMEKFGTWAGEFEQDGLEHVGHFGEAVGKVTAGAKTAADLFVQMNDKLVIPSSQKIDDLYFGIRHLTTRYREMATELGGPTIKALAEVGEGVGRVATASKTSAELFQEMNDELVLPSKQGIDDLVIAIGYVVTRTGEMATEIGTDGLRLAEDFAVGTYNTTQKISGALDLFPKMAESKTKPTVALTEVYDELATTLEVAGLLTGRADAIEQESWAFLKHMEQAGLNYTKGLSLGQGLGGTALGDAPTIPQAKLMTTALPLAALPSGGGGGGGKVVHLSVTVQGNTLLGEAPAMAAELARIMKPELARLGA